MSGLSDWFKRLFGGGKPGVYRWVKGVTVRPPLPETTVTLTLDDQTVVKGVHQGGPESGMFHLPLVDPPNHREWGGWVAVESPGYRPQFHRVNVGPVSPDWVSDVDLQKTVTRIEVPLVQRAPLPQFPPGSYDKTFPNLGPKDKLTYRGQFCGLRVAGAPAVPEGVNFTTTGQSDIIMAMHLDRYPEEWQHKILETYASYGYTHFQQSLGHSRAYGRTIKEYVATSKLIQSYGLFADHWFLGGPGDPRDADAGYYAPVLQPYMDALKGESAIDTACVGWQLDGYNEPGAKIMSIIDYIASELVPHEIPIGTHWMNEAGAWWKTNDTDGRPRNRFEWWQWCRGRISFFHHQGSTTIDIPLYQAKLVDTLAPFGDGRMGTSGLFGDIPFKLVAFECSAQNQFDQKTTEAEGDLRSYLLCCTKGGHGVQGYGNGCRSPEGFTL